MYESYAWPGAYSIKTEFKMLMKWFREKFTNVSKKIEASERKI